MQQNQLINLSMRASVQVRFPPPFGEKLEKLGEAQWHVQPEIRLWKRVPRDCEFQSVVRPTS
jgi:hypothetical protein